MNKPTLKRGFFCALIVCESLFMAQARAEEFRPLYIGTRAQAMGNAFVAIADDEQAIFYNPAGLAGVQGYSFNLAAVDADLSNDVVTGYPTLSSMLGSPSVNQLNNLMGKTYTARGQATSTIVGRGFGLSGIYDYQAAIRVQNTAYPIADIGAVNTYGGQIAFGTRLVRLGRRKFSEIRFGMAGKVLSRAGTYRTIGMTELMSLDSTSLSSALSAKGMGYGLDLGLQGVYPVSNNTTLKFGAAWTDVGDTAFSGGALTQESNLTLGSGITYKGKDMTATLAYDFAHALDYMDWRKKTHLGAEFKFPILSLYAGLSELNFTYGAGLDLAFLKIMYASYVEQLGTLLGQVEERRHRIHVALKIDI